MRAAGTAIAAGAHTGGWGLWLSLLGWLACTAGTALVFVLRTGGAEQTSDAPGRLGRRGFLARPRGAELGPVIMLVLAGLGVAAAFAPSWDSYTLHTAAGQSQSLTAGNAFSNPGLVIAGDVAVMVALAAVVIVAALWRPIHHGALLLAGAIIPMVAQAISALVQAGEATPSTQFGISPAVAKQIGLTINSTGVTEPSRTRSSVSTGRFACDISFASAILSGKQLSSRLPTSLSAVLFASSEKLLLAETMISPSQTRSPSTEASARSRIRSVSNFERR